VHVPDDKELVRRLEDGQTVEVSCSILFYVCSHPDIPHSLQVYVVFMENHMKPSHWFAVCMNVGGSGAAENWKMVGLL
jgi:hypothetical protein